MKKINSLGCSGGRTSMFMSSLFQNGNTGLNDNLPCEHIFCDTGGEDSETYAFLRAGNAHLNLNLICLQAEIHESMGVGNTPVVVPIEDCKFDMTLMRKCTEKYGGFTSNRPYCTDKLKTIISDKYRKHMHGSGSYFTWIGIRYDEPKRLVGDNKKYELSAYKQLKAQGYDDSEISDLFRDIAADLSQLDSKYFLLEQVTKDLLINRRKKQEALGLRYLAEISTAAKQDVIDWFQTQCFDLAIDEHRGNCLFCVKKSELKIALAARDCPKEFEEWRSMVMSESVRLMPADKFGKAHIYRKWLTPDQLIAQFSDSTTEELRERVYKTKQSDVGPCGGSCEAFGDLEQLDLFTDEAA